MSLYCSFNKYISNKEYKLVQERKRKKKKTKNGARNEANIKKATVSISSLSKSIWFLSVGKQKVDVWRDSTKNLPRPI